MTTIMYGLSPKICDSMKKATKWLEQHQIEIEFVDFREQKIDPQTLTRWIDLAGWEKLLNKRSTSYRQLSDTDKQHIDSNKALALMLANPTLIKRPVLVSNNAILTGFSDATYKQWFKL